MADALSEMFAWLTSDDARQAAVSELHRRGLPAALVDDLLGATALALGTASPDHGSIDRPVAYARRALATKAVDLLRGTIRHRREVEWPDELDLPDAAGDATLLGVELEDDLRAAIHRLLAARKAWAGAAALTVLTLAAHRDVALPRDVPEPEGPSGGQSDRWASLWLAGCRDCFPTRGLGDDAAMRQRRSRALRAVDALLADAAASIGLEMPR
jgi:hypothetical protein